MTPQKITTHLTAIYYKCLYGIVTRNIKQDQIINTVHAKLMHRCPNTKLIMKMSWFEMS